MSINSAQNKKKTARDVTEELRQKHFWCEINLHIWTAKARDTKVFMFSFQIFDFECFLCKGNVADSTEKPM